MTKLYIEPDGTWTIPGPQSRQARRADVPNPPAELAFWLSVRRVPAEPVPGSAELERIRELVADQLTETVTPDATPPSGPTPPNTRDPRAAELIALSGDVTHLSEWILAQPGWVIEQLFAAIGARVGELRP